MRLITYQTLLSNPENVARVQAARRQIERIGGLLLMTPASQVGMMLVTLELPEGRVPDEFFPDLPFYLV